MKYRLLFTLSIMAFAAHAMEDQTGDSQLHVLAKKKDYDGCLKLLTDTSWIQQPLPGEAKFPFGAPEKLQEMGASDPLALITSEAAKKMSLFMVTMQKYIDQQVDRAEKMKNALNGQGDTPLGCAREAGGSEQLLKLLDPRNNNAVAYVISTLFLKDSGVVSILREKK